MVRLFLEEKNMTNLTLFGALFIILLVFAFGDFVGVVSKARISTMFVIMATFMVLFMSHAIPADICTTANLTYVTSIGLQFLLVDMGSSVGLSQLRKEWRTVATATISLILAVIGCAIAIPIIGREAALVSMPVIAGGVVAANTMVTASENVGLLTCAALATFIYATQKLIATLPASNGGLKYANRILEEYRRQDHTADADVETKKNEEKELFWQKNKRFYSNFVCLAIAGAIVFLAYLLGEATHGWIGQTMWSMILGILARNLGLVPSHFLRDTSKSVGFFSFLTMITMIPSLAKIDLSEIPIIGFHALVIFVFAMLVIVVAFQVTPLWKICGSKSLALGIAMCQMIGYPGTQLISDEVAIAVGRTDAERDRVSEKLGTAYVIAGFTNVTLLSVVLANFIAKIL